MKLYHALLAGLVASGLVFAQEAATTAPAAAPATEKTAPAKAPAKKEVVKQVTGTISAVDAIANTVIVKGKKAEDTLSVNDKTAIKVAGKAATLADLKADMKVTASYKVEDGKNVAVKITEKVVAAAKPAKAKDTSAAAPAAAPVK